MKYAVFFAGFLFCIPFGTILAAYSPRVRGWVFGALVFGTAISDWLDINLLSCEWYHGTTRGIEMSFIDILAVCVLLGPLFSARRERFRPYWPPSLALMLGYLIYSGVNVALLEPKLFGMFELTKIVRGVIAFMAAAYFIRGKREVKILVLAICLVVLFEGSVALRDRYVYGIHRASATLNHPNLLSLYSCIAVGVLIPQVFSDTPPRWRVLCVVCTALAAGSVILSVSRMGVFALVIVSGAAVLASVGRHLTPRNLAIFAAAVILACGMAAKSWTTLSSRYEEASLETEYLDEGSTGRGMYLREVVPIIRERFFGVGLNNWSYWVSLKYGKEAGSACNYTPYGDFDGATPGIKAAPAHNLAVLTVGELGWFGLLLLAAIWARWFWMGAVFVVRQRLDIVTRYGIGAFFVMVAIFFQSLTEWEFRNTKIFLLTHILMGALAAIYRGTQRGPVDSLPQARVLPPAALARSKRAVP